MPDTADWSGLARAVGGQRLADGHNKYGNKLTYWNAAGGKLKSKLGWFLDGNGTDDYGFSALPGGTYFHLSHLLGGSTGYWWSATEDTVPGHARNLRMRYNIDSLVFEASFKNTGLSARCVRK